MAANNPAIDPSTTYEVQTLMDRLQEGSQADDFINVDKDIQNEDTMTDTDIINFVTTDTISVAEPDDDNDKGEEPTIPTSREARECIDKLKLFMEHHEFEEADIERIMEVRKRVKKIALENTKQTTLDSFYQKKMILM